MKPTKKICDGCGDDRYIWKTVTINGERKRYCKYCWSANEGKNSHKPTAGKPLRSRSLKRVKQEQYYSENRKVFLEKHPLCHIAIPGICTNYSTDIHHRDGREHERLNQQDTFIPCCRKCHEWCHSHPVEARILNFLT